MDKFEKLMRAITLKTELNKLQEEFRVTLEEESSEDKLRKLASIDARLRDLTMQILQLVSSGTSDDKDEMEDFKIER